MAEIHDFETIQDYNDFLGVETLHPLVSVVNMERLGCLHRVLHRFGFYCVFLKDFNCGLMQYGRSSYDYREGTLLYIGPNQVAGSSEGTVVPTHKGWILMFHPDLLLGTPLAGRMHEYSFFSYTSNEALHMSEREKKTIVSSLQNIEEELQNPVDKHSKQIIVANIEVFLNLSKRFYDRQFISREETNKSVVASFDNFLNAYFSSKQPRQNGLPTVAMCASHVHLSPNYFGDLMKKATGKSAQEYIQQFIVARAKEMLFDDKLTISEIAYNLGFSYPHHLSRMFKKVTGVTPNEYRAVN